MLAEHPPPEKYLLRSNLISLIAFRCYVETRIARAMKRATHVAVISQRRHEP
jgi:hypothetical protein